MPLSNLFDVSELWLSFSWLFLRVKPSSQKEEEEKTYQISSCSSALSWSVFFLF